MKKSILSIVFVAAAILGHTQVGVGTETPEGALDVKSTTSGLVVPRVSSAAVVVNPNGGAIQNGTIVYDMSLNCFNFYEDGAWTGCKDVEPPVPTASLLKSPTESIVFMSHDLGADTSADPNTPAKALHGNYYQWGSSTIVADSDTPSGNITGWNTTNNADGSWSDASKTANDPCPEGFRLPTDAEWTGVFGNNTKTTEGSFTAGETNFSSVIHYGDGGANPELLTLPISGFRSANLSGGGYGQLNSRGSLSYHWSSTEVAGGINARVSYEGSGFALIGSLDRTYGFSIRCTAE